MWEFKPLSTKAKSKQQQMQKRGVALLSHRCRKGHLKPALPYVPPHQKRPDIKFALRDAAAKGKVKLESLLKMSELQLVKALRKSGHLPNHTVCTKPKCNGKLTKLFCWKGRGTVIQVPQQRMSGTRLPSRRKPSFHEHCWQQKRSVADASCNIALRSVGTVGEASAHCPCGHRRHWQALRGCCVWRLAEIAEEICVCKSRGNHFRKPQLRHSRLGSRRDA